MRYLTVGEVLELYNRVMKQSGGLVGILNLGSLGSAVAQPRMVFNGRGKSICFGILDYSKSSFCRW